MRAHEFIVKEDVLTEEQLQEMSLKQFAAVVGMTLGLMAHTTPAAAGDLKVNMDFGSYVNVLKTAGVDQNIVNRVKQSEDGKAIIDDADAPKIVNQIKQWRAEDATNSAMTQQSPQSSNTTPIGSKTLWNNIKTGMSADEVLKLNPNLKFDDSWSSMGPAGVLSNYAEISKKSIKVAGEGVGPFGAKSDIYVTFDKNGKSDGVAFTISTSALPEEWKDSGLFGTMNQGELTGFIKNILSNAPQELGSRIGKVQFTDSQGDDLMRVGAGTAIPFGKGFSGIGIGIPLFSIETGEYVIKQKFSNGMIVLPGNTGGKGSSKVFAHHKIIVVFKNQSTNDIEFEPQGVRR